MVVSSKKGIGDRFRVGVQPPVIVFQSRVFCQSSAYQCINERFIVDLFFFGTILFGVAE